MDLAFKVLGAAAKVTGKFSDDDILYVLDLIYDFYESNGLINDDDDDEKEIDIDMEELTEYVVKNAKRDKMARFEAEEIEFIVNGEMEYCDSLGMFD